jgi:protoporphyrinogen/coproporphyrinogen III oxidase
MIGVWEPGEKVTVLGGGISGLLASFRLVAHNRQVHLIEKSARLGGLIHTSREAGFLLEGAAHSLLCTPSLHRFFETLDVKMEPLQKGSRARWIYRHGRPRRFPLSLRECLSMLGRMVFIPSKGEALNLEAWAHKHLGRGVCEGLIYPITQGIHGCSPDVLDQEIAFPRLSLPPGDTLLSSLFRRQKTPKASMQAPSQGMEDIVQKCLRWLKASGRFQVSLETELEALPEGDVVLAVPAPSAARYLPEKASQLLQQITYNPLTVFSFAFKESQKSPKGVGMLVARGEKLLCSGILYSSASFHGRAPSGYHTLSVFVPGVSVDNKKVQNEVRSLFQIEGPFVAEKVWSWPHAIPRYDQALRKALHTLPSLLPKGCVLAGNYTGTLSLRHMIEEALEPLPGRA